MKLHKPLTVMIAASGLSLLAALFFDTPTLATSPWMNGQLDFRITPLESTPDRYSRDCTHQTNIRVVDIRHPAGRTVNYACVTYGKNIDYFYYDYDGYVRIGLDQTFRRLRGVHWADFLDPGTDRFFTVGKRGIYRTQYTMYGSLPSALIADRAVLGAPTVSFHLDKTKSTKLLPDKDYPGYTHAIHSEEKSEDERYMAAYVDRVGFVKIDLQTQVVRFFEIDRSEWYHNPAPRMYDISESGQYVLARSSGLTIYDTVGCGDDFQVYEQLANDYEEVKNQCDHRDIAREFQERYGFYLNDRAFNFQINNDGHTVEFDLYYPDTQQHKHVIVSHDGYNSTRLEYLALGDSISSGEGDTAIDEWDNKYYRQYTDVEENKLLGQPREKCHLSTRSYPYYLARWMELGEPSSSSWNSVACSGAESTDIGLKSSDSYLGQIKGGNLLASDKGEPRLKGYSNHETLQATALNEFIPGRAKQIEFVKKYKPAVITLTAGANDIGFGGKVTSCTVSVETCKWAKEDKALLASQIKDEFSKLSELYSKLHEASSGKAKIYVIGYPKIISYAEPSYCDNTLNLNSEERELIVNATDYLNSTVEAAAEKAGVQYIDISDALEGGQLCQEGQEYMTAISMMGGNELQESFHPNDYGHIMMTQAIQDQLGDTSLLDYDICPQTSATICPDTSVEASPIPASLGGDTDVNSENMWVTASRIMKTVLTPIYVQPYTFMPNSSVGILAHSEPVHIGTYTAGDDGSLTENIVIPGTLDPGYHTLVLKGKTYSGEPITITQTVLVTSTDKNDLDGNGVQDSQEVCGPFWTDALGAGAKDACLREDKNSTDVAMPSEKDNASINQSMSTDTLASADIADMAPSSLPTTQKAGRDENGFTQKIVTKSHNNKSAEGARDKSDQFPSPSVLLAIGAALSIIIIVFWFVLNNKSRRM